MICTGVKHEGVAEGAFSSATGSTLLSSRANHHTRHLTGKIEQIAGFECYVATPTTDYAKEKVILFLSDVFGLALINNKVRGPIGSRVLSQYYLLHSETCTQLLADSFARNGFKVVMPDLFNGDPIEEGQLNSTTFDRAGWMSRHGEESWKPIVDGVVAALKADGVTVFGTTGYCFGAPPCFHLAFSNTSKATVVSHPSRLQAPDDFKVRSHSRSIPDARDCTDCVCKCV